MSAVLMAKPNPACLGWPTGCPMQKNVYPAPTSSSSISPDSLVSLKGTLYSVKKKPYTEGLLCLLLHSEGTAIFYVD